MEDDHVIWWKVSNLMPFPWNLHRQTIEPYLTDWKNDSQQSDEIKANWNQATDTKKQCKTHFMAMKEHMRYKADTTPPRSRTQNISLCFLISISAVTAVILKVVLKLTSISPRDLGESLRTRRRRRSAFIYHTFHQSVFYTQSAVRSS